MQCMYSADVATSVYHMLACHVVIMLVPHSCVRRQDSTNVQAASHASPHVCPRLVLVS